MKVNIWLMLQADVKKNILKLMIEANEFCDSAKCKESEMISAKEYLEDIIKHSKTLI